MFGQEFIHFILQKETRKIPNPGFQLQPQKARHLLSLESPFSAFRLFYILEKDLFSFASNIRNNHLKIRILWLISGDND